MMKINRVIMSGCLPFMITLLYGDHAVVKAYAKTPGNEKSFYNDHARGWFWYEDPDVELLDEEKKEESKREGDTGPKPKSATERLKDIQETLKELKARAILEPTRANVKAYQDMQLKMVNQSEAFSKAWMMNVYMNPYLDENVNNPSAAAARFVVYDAQNKETTSIIQALKSTYGLFYFFQGNCPYCQSFGPILKQFAAKYEWEVMAVSLDGSPSALFPNWHIDNGIAKQWNVGTVPAVFAVNPETGHVIPVAFGFTAIDQMEKRIVHMVKGMKSE